jgi:hypothetical protein
VITLPLAPLASLLLAFAAPAPRPICKTIAHCGTVARQALAAGQLEASVRAATLQLHYAECSQDEAEQALAASAIETLATAELRRGAPLMARAWLDVDAAERKALPEATQARITAAAARLPAAPDATGTYRRYERAGLWDAVQVRQVDAEHVHFALSALRLSGKWCDKIEVTAAGDLSVAVAATGDLEGDAALSGDEYVYETREYTTQDEWSKPCVLRLRFEDDAVRLTQDGTFHDCGFGYGVNASGPYVRTSRTAPRFAPPKPRPSPTP